MSEEAKAFRPEQLVDPLTPIDFTPLRVVRHALKFQFIVEKDAVGLQLTLDEIQKFQKEKSHPLRWFHLDDVNMLDRLWITALAARCALALKPDSDKLTIGRWLDDLYGLMRNAPGGLVDKVKVALEAIERKKAELK